MAINATAPTVTTPSSAYTPQRHSGVTLTTFELAHKPIIAFEREIA